jgi:hypothetical protein
LNDDLHGGIQIMNSPSARWLATAALTFAVAVPGIAAAATQTLFDGTLAILPSASSTLGGTVSYVTPPLVLSSRGTLTASIAPDVTGAAIQSLSFNLTTAAQTTAMSYTGPNAWSDSIVLDAGTYFAVASGRAAPVQSNQSPFGIFGLKLTFTPSSSTEIPLPPAAWLFAGALAAGATFVRRRRAAGTDAAEAVDPQRRARTGGARADLRDGRVGATLAAA